MKSSNPTNASFVQTGFMRRECRGKELAITFGYKKELA